MVCLIPFCIYFVNSWRLILFSGTTDCSCGVVAFFMIRILQNCRLKSRKEKGGKLSFAPAPDILTSHWGMKYKITTINIQTNWLAIIPYYDANVQLIRFPIYLSITILTALICWAIFQSEPGLFSNYLTASKIFTILSLSQPAITHMVQ